MSHAQERPQSIIRRPISVDGRREANVLLVLVGILLLIAGTVGMTDGAWLIIGPMFDAVSQVQAGESLSNGFLLGGGIVMSVGKMLFLLGAITFGTGCLVIAAGSR